jgi:hypothetical protein
VFVFLFNIFLRERGIPSTSQQLSTYQVAERKQEERKTKKRNRRRIEERRRE